MRWLFLTKFDNVRVKTVDFLVIAKLWLSSKFSAYPSTYFMQKHFGPDVSNSRAFVVRFVLLITNFWPPSTKFSYLVTLVCTCYPAPNFIYFPNVLIIVIFELSHVTSPPTNLPLAPAIERKIRMKKVKEFHCVSGKIQ